LVNNKYKMSAGSISLESSIRTCKVNPEEADRIESDRFLNPHNMVCPMWNGVDLTGRQVCPDSFYTKRAGCNSAEDRVVVENNVSRPQYFEYITLSSNGLKAADMYNNNTNYHDSRERTMDLQHIASTTPNFGKQFGATVINNCGTSRYQQAMNQTHAQHSRNAQAVHHAKEAYDNLHYSGC
jgi:hypothetical protein